MTVLEKSVIGVAWFKSYDRIDSFFFLYLLGTK